MRDTVMRARRGNLGLRLDPRSGLPEAVLLDRGGERIVVPLAMTASLVTEGDEVFRPPSRLGYENTRRLDDFRAACAAPRYRADGPTETYSVDTTAGEWAVRWHYTFRRRHPRLEITVELGPEHADAVATLRDLVVRFEVAPEDLSSWRLEAPGNELRPGVAADALTEPVTVAPIGGTRGSAGLIALHRPALPRTLVLWPFSRTELADVNLAGGTDAVRVDVATGLAGRLPPGESLGYGRVALDLLDRTWEDVRDDVPSWYGPLGLTTPRDRPDWVAGASIYEVQIGYSVFWDGYRYAPYPTAGDLLADLPRIRGLGYDVVQIMPRQPYPSYNVHDYADVSTSYGDEADLRAVVDRCHALGMRVILDILLHGVIDQEVMARTADRVRQGPYYPRLAEDTTNAWGQGPAARDAMALAWSRHIVDFEPHWSAGSPPRHRLVDEHPDWFMRDSAGNVIGIYTKAFDAANAEWQEYFCAAAEDLVRRLDIDGFRFDAPTYNALPNWSAETERRASYSPLGSLELFDRLRPRLKRLDDDAVLYTEPSGAAFRQAMDLTYNYEEQWLVPSVLGDPAAAPPTSVRNGRELAAWFRDRDATLPPGSLVCHHIDSHDTFWWPLPGRKWRREQYGVEATRALLAVFALSGGAFMTFVGGEEGIEDDVRRVHRLRDTLPEVARGTADFRAVRVDGDDSDAVYAVVRRDGANSCVLLVNLSAEEVDTTCRVAVDAPAGARFGVRDGWRDDVSALEGGDEVSAETLRRLPVRLDPYEPRLLVLRPAAAHGGPGPRSADDRPDNQGGHR